MRFFAPFFLQTVPPCPITDDLGLFHFLVNFHKVIGRLKRFPGVRDIGETIINFDVRTFFKTFSRCLGHR